MAGRGPSLGLNVNTCPRCLQDCVVGPGAETDPGHPDWYPSCHQSFCAWEPLLGQGPSWNPDMLFLGRGSYLPHRDAQN